MPKVKFTDLSVRTLPEGLYFDERTPGFGIRVGKHRKTWLIVKEPNRTKINFPTLTLADARKRALVAIGTPMEASHAPTFPDVRAEYLAQGKWRPKTRYETTRTLTRHFHWTKTLDKITHRDVLEAVELIDKPSEAAHAFRDLSVFFNWCVPRYLKSSPCQGLKSPAKYIPRSRILTDDEIVKVWRAVETMRTYGHIIQACLTTGQRVGEISKIKPNWIQENHLVIPASVAKNGREHSIPLSPTSVHLLKTLASSSTPFGTISSKLKAKLDRASTVSDWTIHDLRRTVASTLQRLGVRIEVTERLLNHISGTQAGIVSVYQQTHDFWPEMQQAVDKYEQFLLALLAR